MSVPPKRNNRPWRWALRVTLLSFGISIALTLAADRTLDGAGIAVSVCVLLVFIAVNIAFDIVGMAVATVSPKPFHSMAARRVAGASDSLRLIKNADRVSSFCADVVGDICGILSGTSAAAIVLILSRGESENTFAALIVTGLLAGITVGGKAVGKPVAMNNNVKIVLFLGKIMRLLPKRRKKN